MAIICTLAGCDRVIKAETFPERATIEQDASVSCTHLSYCYGLGLNGKFGFGLSALCPGTEKAVVKHIPARRIYESGRVENYTIDTTILVKGECQ